jgi:3-deoxy-7-phosphoheptulonate synthase
LHRNPAEALSDKEQALSPAQFSDMMRKVRILRKAMDELR